MYDAADDPYTYENSTVLVNKLGLRDQGELDNFEAEITNARAGEPLPEGDLDFAHYCAIHHHAFREGDGRTQLTFFALLAERAGQPLDLEKLDSDAPCFMP